jgi:diadenosine tetraphosphatase ApaH/serine/threonine PP2A family protein phosphatase
MKLAIISDIHANLEALEAVLARIDKERVDQIACLGDVVGYGASPDECCTLIRERASFCLLGNHDAAVTGAMDEAYYYDAARTALRWTREHVSEANYKWLYGLPYTRLDGDLGFYHSAPIMPSGFFYVVQASEAQTHAQIHERLRPLSFIGHAHLTTIFGITAKKVKTCDAKQVTLKDETRYIVNVGSVGQPRDRDPRACFALWDTADDRLQFVRVEYDIESSAAKILTAGLDEKFAKRLYLGV